MYVQQLSLRGGRHLLPSLIQMLGAEAEPWLPLGSGLILLQEESSSFLGAFEARGNWGYTEAEAWLSGGL